MRHGSKHVRRIRRVRRPGPVQPTDAIDVLIKQQEAKDARAREVDQELRRRTRQIETDVLDMMELANEVIEKHHYATFGYNNPARYFEERLGIAYRTVRKYLAVLAALGRVHKKDRDEARHAVAALGVARASTVAPLIQQEPGQWADIVKQAREQKREELQKTVSSRLGSKRRGRSAKPVHQMQVLLDLSRGIKDWVKKNPSPNYNEKQVLGEILGTLRRFLKGE